MASATQAVQTVTPVVAVKPEVKTKEVKVTVGENEFAAILHNATEKLMITAFELQDSYENQSSFTKDALHDAAVMFLKAQCQRSISQWDNLVSKMTKVQKYSAMTRKQIEDDLKTHPKFAPYYKIAIRAAGIKNSL